MKLFLLTAFTLVAFAANSFLCRAALGDNLIDPVSFTTIRLLGGALALLPFARRRSGSWVSGVVLFAYAITFSLAYVSLTTGMGALILFGTVQVTMIGTAIRTGDRLTVAQWIGSIAAMGGLVYLVLPGISAPDPMGALLMTVAGLGWGVYSIMGRGAGNPVAMTAGNFLRAAPLALVASLIARDSVEWETAGVMLALTSGVVTSGLGYVLWYAALRSLTTTQASLLQLLVPVLAAFAGVVFLSEDVSARLMIASALILGGVGVAIARRKPIAIPRG